MDGVWPLSLNLLLLQTRGEYIMFHNGMFSEELIIGAGL